MIYLDSAAVVKLVRQEEHSAELVDWLNAHLGVPLVSSALVEVEVPRAAPVGPAGPHWSARRGRATVPSGD